MAKSALGLNRTFQIKNEDGTVFNDLVLHKAVYDSVVMSLGDKITGDVYCKDNMLAVTMSEYIEYDGVKFVLVNPPTIVREGLVNENSNLKGMTKYSFEFYHPMYMLSNIPFTDVAVSVDEKRYKSQDKTFYWIGTCNDYIAKLNKNLDKTEWLVVASDNKESQDMLSVLSDVMSFDNDSIADALKKSYETWGTPYVVSALHEGEYYDSNNIDYYSEEGGSKRFVIVLGLPSNEIIDSQSEYGTTVDADTLAIGNIYYNTTPILVPANTKLIVESLEDSQYPIILNESHNGVIGTTNRTFDVPTTVYVGLSRAAGKVRYFFDGEESNIFVFKFGQGVGLKNNSRTPRNNKIVTRIAGFGSEDNIPYGYPQIPWTGDPSATKTQDGYPIYNGIVNGQNVKLIKHPFTRTHLMPSIFSDCVNRKVNPFAEGYDPDTEIIDYYDADGTYPNPLVENAPSYETHEFDTIKPELGVESIIDAKPINNDGTIADEWVDGIDDDGNYIQSYFQVTLPALGFDIYACAAITQQMQINMRSGACIGCTFTVQVDWEDYKKNFYDENGQFAPDGEQRDLEKYPDSTSVQVTLILQKETSTFGTLMPNVYQNPKANDEFVILGISMPLSYISNAEHRLDEEMKSYMLSNNIYYFDYPLKFDEHFLSQRTDILQQIKPNTIVRFEFGRNVEPLMLYVKRLSIKYGEAPLPQYDITLTDNIEVALNQIGRVVENVEKLGALVTELRKGGSGSGGGGGSQSASDKLSRVSDDEANGLIGFKKGLWIKLKGLFGWDADGNINANNIIAGGDMIVNNNENVLGDLDVSGRTNAMGGIRTNEVRSDNYSGDGIADTGYLLSNNIAGRSKLIIDEIYVRVKAVFEALEVKKWSVTAGDEIRSCASNTINRVDYYDGNGALMGYSVTRVPWRMKGILFLLSHFSNGLGRKIYSTVKNVRVELTDEQLKEVRVCRCYFLAKDGEKEVDNWWKSDSEYGHDYARCQTMNLKNTNRETYTSIKRKIGNVFWWRKVVAVSSTPIELEHGKSYHYFDVAYNYLEEQQGQTNYAAAGSDIPAAGDDVVQFGNDINAGRMNLIISQVNGGGRFDYDTSDAPCIKFYKGIYTFDLTKCWFGGNPCKTKLSPSTGYVFNGPEFRFTTEYGVVPVAIQRGAWTDIPLETDDYSPYGQVRKCYYYDEVSHKGCTWLCSIADSAHWVDASGHYISDAAYAALTDAQKALCSRKPNYTTAEPATNSPDWTLLTEKGDSSVEIYRWYDSTYDDTNRPPTPSGQTGSIIPPQGWSKSAPNRPAEGYNLWMSNGTTDHDGLLVGTWSRPIRISGDKGTAGEDGSDMEWIYIAVSTVGGWSPNYPPNSNKDKNGTQHTAEYVATHDDFVPYGWSDNPNGISRTIPYEYACFRKKPQGKNQQWGLFSEPIMWSHWGRNGMDGDGVEYVFIRTTKEIAPELDHTQSGYDVDEYLPAIINQSACGAEANRCTDDNKGVNSTYRYEWGISRTKSAPNVESGVRTWNKFTGAGNDYKMSLWERYAEDGKSITKASETYRYATNNTGVRPAASSSDWKTTKPTLQKGYWLYTETTITWSDGSTTVLYTDERNPNDGVAGQDIVVDGSTEMKYYVGSSNTTHPAEDSSDWKDLSQVTQTQGKWLWSKATTWYKKASSASGAKDAGHSVNYNVSYIAIDGTTPEDARGITAITEYYKATNSSAAMPAPSSDTGWDTDPNLSHLSEKWDANHIYLWNYEKVEYNKAPTVVRTVPQILAIWTKDGTNGADGRGIDSITNMYKVTNNSTPPKRAHEGGTGWDNDPIAPANGEYLWNYEIIAWTKGTSPTYTDVQLIGYVGTNGTNGTNGVDALTIDTDNDSDAFGTDSDNLIVEQQIRTTHVKMFSGVTAQNLTNLTATLFNNDDTAVSSGIAKVDVSYSGTQGTVTVTFYSGATVYANSIYALITATCAKGSLSTKFTNQKVKSGAAGVSPDIFQLKPSPTSLAFGRDASGSLTPATKSVSISIVKTKGSTQTEYTTAAAAGVTVRYSTSSMPSSASAGTGWSSGAISVVNSAESLYIAMFNSSGVLLDRETIPVLKEGQKGANGKDGWMVTASPANVVLTQDLNTPTTFSSATVSFSAKKGNTTASIASLGTLTLDRFVASKSGKTVVVTAPDKMYGNYFSEGSFSIVVNVTDPDTNQNVEFTIVVPCYANLLGVWKQSIQDGTETSIAEKLSYEIFDDQVHTIDQTGEYIRGWGENTSKLQKVVGRNMLDCADGAGWRYFGSNEPADYNASNQRVLPESGTSTVDAFTSSVWLESGTTYVFSVYTPSSPSFRWRKVDSPEQAGKEGTQYSVTVVSAGSGRYYCTFAPTASGYYKMNVWGVSYVEKAQLEVGTVPTAWESTKNYSSEIKQTAEEIKLSVKDDLGETGIDITNHKIEMQADDFVLKNSGGSQVVGVNARGDFEVAGTIKATNFYHHVCYYFGGGVCLNGGDKYVKGGLEYDTSGYADIIEIKQSYNGNWSWSGSYKNNYTILLPDPSTCEGKIVTVYCGVVYCTGNIALGCVGTNKMVTRWSISNGVLVPESISGDQPRDAVDLEAGRYIEGYRLSNGWSGSRTVDVDLFEPVVYAFAAQKSGSNYYWFQVK